MPTRIFRAKISAIRQGFTLLELLVVIAILGLIMSSAYVRVAPVYRKARFRECKERLVHFMVRVRSHSNRVGTVVTLEFDDHEIKAGNRTFRSPEFVTVSAEDSEVIHHGQSRSFIVGLQSDVDEAWLLFAGGTGQVSEMASKRDAKALLSSFRVNSP